MQRLTDDQLGALVRIILDELGTGLTRRQFTDAALILFEDIPGFERLLKERAARYLQIVWLRYQRSSR